jgi:nucleotidyltransferase AbiEii toxin of type IV toxin-antitoxin system
VTPTRKPPTGPPPSAGVLAKYAQAFAREADVSEGRVRSWISYMIMAGVLERAAVGGSPRFIVKGGVALELRLRNRARATKDIDVVLQHTEADLARTLERALTGDAYQGFAFRRKREPLLLENRTVNMEFAVSYRGGAWAGIVVDIARAEPGESEIEWVRAIPLTEVFGVTGPVELPCLPLRLHIAQKLHGMTLPPRPGKRNERFRDLIDVLLMEDSSPTTEASVTRASRSSVPAARTTGPRRSLYHRIGSNRSLAWLGTSTCRFLMRRVEWRAFGRSSNASNQRREDSCEKGSDGVPRRPVA